MDRTMARIHRAANAFETAKNEVGSSCGDPERIIDAEGMTIYTENMRIRIPVDPDEKQMWDFYFKSASYFNTLMSDSGAPIFLGAPCDAKMPWMLVTSNQYLEEVPTPSMDDSPLSEPFTIPASTVLGPFLKEQTKFVLDTAMTGSQIYGGEDTASVYGEFLIGCGDKRRTNFSRLPARLSEKPYWITTEFLGCVYGAIAHYKPRDVAIGVSRIGAKDYMTAYILGDGGEQVEVQIVATAQAIPSFPSTEGEPTWVDLLKLQELGEKYNPPELYFTESSMHCLENNFSKKECPTQNGAHLSGIRVFVAESGFMSTIHQFSGSLFQLWFSQDRRHLIVSDESGSKTSIIKCE